MAVGRLRAAEDAATVLDDRFVAAFSLAGTTDDCRVKAAKLAEAGVTELALTFVGDQAAADVAYLASARAARSIVR